jgi:hypothetical protein
MAMTNLGLAVLEARWENHKEHTVRPYYETLASQFCNNPRAFHYEMFNNASSLKEMIPGVAGTKGIRHIVLAAHGDKKGIQGARGNEISRKHLSTALYAIDKNIDGLFLGCCEVGRLENAKWLMFDYGDPKGIQVQWIAGYSKSPNWLRSAAFEVLFWTLYFQQFKQKPATTAGLVRLCQSVRCLANGLVEELGVTLCVRARGYKPGSGAPDVRDLFATEGENST